MPLLLDGRGEESVTQDIPGEGRRLGRHSRQPSPLDAEGDHGLRHYLRTASHGAHGAEDSSRCKERGRRERRGGAGELPRLLPARRRGRIHARLPPGRPAGRRRRRRPVRARRSERGEHRDRAWQGREGGGRARVGGPAQRLVPGRGSRLCSRRWEVDQGAHWRRAWRESRRRADGLRSARRERRKDRRLRFLPRQRQPRGPQRRGGGIPLCLGNYAGRDWPCAARRMPRRHEQERQGHRRHCRHELQQHGGQGQPRRCCGRGGA
mmetsp:Transcript_15482/g.60534  ORF Transcript_15482/g.60534 Transcript_15482/m.60534 type:complete len:265 (-) Transcript_15482:279-1073(-)